MTRLAIPYSPTTSSPMARSKASAPSRSCTTFRGKESGADGLALDDRDRVYITTLTGVQVFDAKGGYLGTIKLGRQPANVAFAGPGRQTLYITAREGLYRVKMLARGPDRPGK